MVYEQDFERSNRDGEQALKVERVEDEDKEHTEVEDVEEGDSLSQRP